MPGEGFKGLAAGADHAGAEPVSAPDPVHGTDAERWGGWHWSKPRHGEHFRRCSYCGSVHPEDLAAEPAWHAEWADRKYGWPHKFYADIPNRSASALFVVGAQSGGTGRPDWKAPSPMAGKDGLGWVAFEKLTRAQRKIAERDGWGVTRDDHSDYYDFGTRASHFGKFYTVHLADPCDQRRGKGCHPVALGPAVHVQ